MGDLRSNIKEDISVDDLNWMTAMKRKLTRIRNETKRTRNQLLEIEGSGDLLPYEVDQTTNLHKSLEE